MRVTHQKIVVISLIFNLLWLCFQAIFRSETPCTYTSQRHDVMTRSAVNNLLVAERCHLDVRKHFFSNRIVQEWNSLPIEVRDADCLNSFKILYDEFFQTKIILSKQDD